MRKSQALHRAVVQRLCILCVCLVVSACAQPPSLAERQTHAVSMASSQGWVSQTLLSRPLALVAYTPSRNTASDTLVVYIEGDGLAWFSTTRASSNPTPSDPLALRMALVHPGPEAVAYLARPCQFVLDIFCDKRYWTDARFSDEVIASTSDAIDHLLQQSNSRHLVLVGYSGGGAVAALVAAVRTDVAALVTVAGNLDVQGWVHHHRLTPLERSQDPALTMPKLASVPQIHWVGGKDSVVPASLTLALAHRLRSKAPMVVQVIPNFDHVCCWAKEWPKMWQQLPSLWRP